MKPGSPTLGSLRANRPDGSQSDMAITADDISDAAEALRAVEIEAVRDDEEANADTVQWNTGHIEDEEIVIPVNLEGLSIDELRAVAGMLQIPNYAQITDQDELIDTIKMYVEPKAPKPR